MRLVTLSLIAALSATLGAQSRVDLGTTLRVTTVGGSVRVGRLLGADSALVATDKWRISPDTVVRWQRRSTYARHFAAVLAPLGVIAGALLAKQEVAHYSCGLGLYGQTCEPRAPDYETFVPVFVGVGAVAGAVLGTLVPRWQTT